MFLFFFSSHTSSFFLNHNFSPKSLWLKKVLLGGRRSHSGGRPSIQLRFPVPYLLVAAHSNPLINFPEGSLLFESPSSLMNCIPDLSNIASNYSMLYHVLLEKRNQGWYFHACLSGHPWLITVPFCQVAFTYCGLHAFYTYWVRLWKEKKEPKSGCHLW